MKTAARAAGIVLDVIMVLAALIRICAGSGEWFDWLLVIGELVIVIPACLIARKGSDKVD